MSVKLVGPRSLETKLRRLSVELQTDSARIQEDPALRISHQDIVERLGRVAVDLEALADHMKAVP